MDDETFDYFNIDINLLTLHILLEGFYRGKDIFSLEQFLKGNYWKIEEIAYEIRDTTEHSSVEDLVLHQIIKIVNDLKIGKIKRVSITSTSSLLETVVEKAVKDKDTTSDNVLFYTGIIEEIYNLKKIEDLERDKKFEIWEKKEKSKTTTNNSSELLKFISRVDFTTENFGKHFEYITAISAPFIEFEIEFDQKKVKEVNNDIEDYINSYYQDDYIESKPIYREKRLYFSKQIENFFEYIKKFPVVGDFINIPFSSLSEQDFEVIKILTYLEKEKHIKIKNWNDIEMWNVKFHKIPITLSSILDQENTASITNTVNTQEVKLNLSFFPQTGTLVLTDKIGKEYKIKVQGQVQREVLRVIFQTPKNTYTEWSLYDISELLGSKDVDRTAVKNAIYQFNKKVKLNIPMVENIFELTKHSARLNPKFVKIN